MKRTTFDDTRDQRIANESSGDSRLMCSARGCPNPWSVSKDSGTLCSAHAWIDPHLWPQVTQEQLDAAAERARRVVVKLDPPPLSATSKNRILRNLGELFRSGEQKSGKDWAYALKECEEAGEKLSQAQRDMWRAALGRGEGHAGH